MKKIQLVNSIDFAIIDNKDFDIVSKHRWSLQSGGYVRTWIGREMVYLHRFLLGAKKGQEVDHKNNDKLDNRIENLRICTRSQNNINKDVQGRNKIGFKGVNWDKTRGKFLARIGVNGKGINLGRFETDVEAATAYNQAAVKHYGDFAHLNEV